MIVLTDIPDPARPRGYVIESLEANNAAASDVPTIVVLPPPSDLQVDQVIVPLEPRMSGDPVNVQWVVRNHGTEPAVGRWVDSVFLSRDGTWDLGDRWMGTLAPNQGKLVTLDPDGSYTSRLTMDLPAALPDDYRVIVRTDIFDDIFEGPDNDNNAGVSSDLLEIRVREMIPDIPLHDLLPRVTQVEGAAPASAERLYQVNVAEGETLEIRLDSENDDAANELYVLLEGLPSTLQFDAAFAGGLQGDQRLLLPRTDGGRYFVLVRSTSNPADSPITLTARLLPFGITEVTPDAGGDPGLLSGVTSAENPGLVTTTIRGTSSVRRRRSSW